MTTIDLIQNHLSKTIQPENLFIFEGKYLQAIAFLQGEKNEIIDEAKDIVKKSGFKYNYQYECYVKKVKAKKEVLNGAYRKEKDTFLDRIIKWKIKRN